MTHAPNDIMKYFTYEHLKDQELRDTSKIVCDAAKQLNMILPPGAEKSTALRKLLEAKDAAVRSMLG